MSGFDNEVAQGLGLRLSPATVAASKRTQKSATDLGILNSTGSPEGVLFGNVGSLAIDHLTGDIYRKTSGTGNTGWQIDASTDLHTSKIIIGDLDNGANYSDFATAIAAASAGDIITIQDGSYNIGTQILKNGLNFVAQVPRGGAGNATRIIGKFIDNGTTVNATFTNIQFDTDSDYSIQLTGANSFISLNNCYNFASDNTPFSIATSGTITIKSADIDLNTTGINLFDGVGVLIINDSVMTNSGGTSSAITGSILMNDSSCSFPLSFSGNGVLISRDSTFNTPNSTPITTAGSSAVTLISASINAGNATAISIGSGTTVNCFLSNINSTNTNAISGSGTLRSADIVFDGTSSNIAATVQVPMVTSNDAIKVVTPSAYPYTVQAQDALVKVDSSSARTINLSASPTTGQGVLIKDTVGSASSNNITVSPAAGNIDGAASYTITSDYGFVYLRYTGTEWSIVCASSSGGGSYSSLAPFIVGSSFADYATIQAAIDAAVLLTPTRSTQINIYIKAKGSAYTENLDLTGCDGVNLIGLDSASLGDYIDSDNNNAVKIIGTHTVPAEAQGRMKFYNLQLYKDDGIMFNLTDSTGQVSFIFDFVNCTVYVDDDDDRAYLFYGGAFTLPTFTFTNCLLTGGGVLFRDDQLHADFQGVTISINNCSYQISGSSTASKGGITFAGLLSSYNGLTCNFSGTSTFAHYESNSSFGGINVTTDNLIDSDIANCNVRLGQYNVNGGQRPLFNGCAFNPGFPLTYGGTIQPILNDCSGTCGFDKVSDVIIAAYTTLITDNFVPVDTTGGAVTVTLFADPFNGMRQTIKDIGGAAGSANITIAGNIDTSAGGASITTNFGSLTLTYNLALTTWMTS